MNIKLAGASFCALSAALLAAPPALGQGSIQAADPAPPSAGSGDVVIVTGTRRAERTVADSAVPVDVVSAGDLGSVVSPDLNDKLSQLVPSFNVQRLPLADGAIFVRPATLRGLAPDQTLVLINGKRRHRSAYIDVTAQGAQGVDLSQIPLIAVRQTEVLRDGASAQYGSDAIAGVVNILLKNDQGFDAETQAGQYYEGDGRTLQAAGRAGLSFTEGGSLNLSFEYASREATSRSQQRTNAAAVAAAGNPNIRNPVQRFGQPDSETWRFFANAELQVAEGIEGYAFGNYGRSWGQNDFNYRSPGAPNLDGTFPTTGALAPNSTFTRPPLLVSLYPTWDLRSIFPGGFTPVFASTTDDVGAVAGVRGDLSEDLSWDLSGRFGWNRIEYKISDTINASLGPNSPTSFHPGTRAQTELGLNLDFNYLWSVGLDRPVNVGFGTEWRNESYEIGIGDPASYTIGPIFVLPAGSNGFFGTAPNQAGTFDRKSYAAYVDLDIDINERLNLGIAGRGESYDEFGETWNGKVSGRYALFEGLNLRAAASTGFRAPTPGQANLTNTNQFPSNDGTVIFTNGLIPATNPVAIAFGAKPLKPEESTNYSAGVVFNLIDGLTVTADVYRIKIDDRIGLAGLITLTDAQRAALVASGVSAAAGLTSFNFYTNGYATQTDGVDIVATYTTPVGPGDLSITAAFNQNETEVTSSTAGVITPRVRQYIEDRLPRTTANVSLSYDVGDYTFLARARHYGEFTEPFSDTLVGGILTENQTFPSRTFVDLSVAYALSDALTLTAGLENALDEYPEKALFGTANGRVYPSQRPYEADGGRYYVRLAAHY